MLIPNVDFGGAQRVFHDHSALLASRFDVTEACFNLDGGQAYPTGNRLISLGVGGGGGPIRKLANLIRRVIRLRALKRDLSPDVTISHLEGAHYVSVLSGGRDRKILCIHGSLLKDRALGRVRGAIVRNILVPLLHRRADRIVTVSNEIADELRQLGVPSRLVGTIHNFFDADAIRARAAEGLDPRFDQIFEKPVLITSGRLALQKNQAPLLDIIGQLRTTRDARLVILGDGELRQQLLSHAHGLGLRTFDAWSGAAPDCDFDVYFLGYQQNPFPFLARASLFLLPSGWEGFPMVIGEAMACGLPVLAADCATGPREFIAPSSDRRPPSAIEQPEHYDQGILMPMLDDPATMTQAIATWAGEVHRLLGNDMDRRRIGGASLRRAEDFSVARCGGQWLQLVGDLAGAEVTASNRSR